MPSSQFLRNSLFSIANHINMNYNHQDEKHSTHMQHLTTSVNNYPALVFFISSPFFIFTFSFFIFRFQRRQIGSRAKYFHTTNSSWQTIRWEKFVQKRKLWTIRALIDIDRDRERYAVPSSPRGRDPCLCWPAVGVVLSQALLSASSMKSAIARNCLELAQSNHPPFPVRIRAYINR